MFKRSFAALALVSIFISAAPADPPGKTLGDLETAYRDRVTAAKRAYAHELAKANKDLLASLEAMKTDRVRAGDDEQASAIQMKISDLIDKADPKEDFGPIKNPHGPSVDLTQKHFFGVGGDGKRVIFLCDCSGSMLGIFGELKQQLKNSVNALDANQEFNIVFFNEESDPLFKDGAAPFTEANRRKAMEFIENKVSSGGTQPISALDFALKDKPDLLFVLTDGFDQIANFDDVTSAFKNGNPDGKIKVDCIFLESDPDPKLDKALRQVAEMGHGEFKKISKSEM